MNSFERAARALSGAMVAKSYDDFEPEDQKMVRDGVIAVLRAVREASPDMIEAGSECASAAVWRRMIDTLIAQGEG